MDQTRIIKRLLKKFKRAGVVVNKISVADTGSVYFEFKAGNLGSLRVSTHPNKLDRHCLWHLRADVDAAYITKQEGHLTYVYPLSDINLMLLHMKSSLSRDHQYNQWEDLPYIDEE